MSKTRNIIAIIISPFITGFIFTILFIEAIGGPSPWGGEIILLFIFIPGSYIIAASIGYSSIPYLKKRHKLNILWLCLSGFIIGSVITILVFSMYYIARLGDPEWTRITKNISILIIFKILMSAGLSSAFGAFIFSLISGVAKIDNVSLTNHSSSPTKKRGLGHGKKRRAP